MKGSMSSREKAIFLALSSKIASTISDPFDFANANKLLLSQGPDLAIVCGYTTAKQIEVCTILEEDECD